MLIAIFLFSLLKLVLSLPPNDDVESVLLEGTPSVNFLSTTLGNHMVLQRAPQRAVVWGSTTIGATVTTTFKERNFTTVADKDGVWRQFLPATQASSKAYTILFESSTGETASLQDILFGDVFLCGGQSNMGFSMSHVENASVEIQKANKYPWIRLFTVGRNIESTTPLQDLQTVAQNWSVASSSTITGSGRYGGWFSAVCWFFGREIADMFGSDLPIGLIVSNKASTKIEEWSTSGAFAACNRTSANGNFFNAMINPYTIGPMALTGFAWYQGEANAANQASADAYSCLFPAMISAWRSGFSAPAAYFGFIQLSTSCGRGFPELRQAQMKALFLDKVAYATNADHGAGCNVHPPAKQYCGKRLGTSALALQYKLQIPWRSPSYESSKFFVSETQVSALVSLKDVVGELMEIYPFNYVTGLNCTAEKAGTCAWAALEISGLGWINATITISNGSSMLLQAPLKNIEKVNSVIGTAYGWGGVPMMSVYDKFTSLPVLPWYRSKTKSTMKKLYS